MYKKGKLFGILILSVFFIISNPVMGMNNVNLYPTGHTVKKDSLKKNTDKNKAASKETNKKENTKKDKQKEKKAKPTASGKDKTVKNDSSKRKPERNQRRQSTKRHSEGIVKSSNIKIYLFFLLLGAAMMYFLIYYKIKNIFDYEFEAYNEEKNYLLNFKKDILPVISLVRYLKERKDYHKKENKKLKTELDDLKNKINLQSKAKADRNSKQQGNNWDSYSKNQEIYNKSQTENFTSNSFENATKPNATPKENKPKIIVEYYSVPGYDGCFKRRNASMEYNLKKFYKIEYEEGSTKGKISYISDINHDGRPINTYEDDLQPACEILNLENRDHARQVKMIEPGEVSLINEKWCVNPNKKVKVKFI